MKKNINPTQFEWKQQSSTLRYMLSHPANHIVSDKDLQRFKESILLAKSSIMRDIVICELRQALNDWTPDTVYTA